MIFLYFVNDVDRYLSIDIYFYEVFRNLKQYLLILTKLIRITNIIILTKVSKY